MRAVTLVMYYHGALHNLCLWFFFKQVLCQEQRFVTVHCENAYFYTPSTQSCADACLISDMFSGLRVTKKKKIIIVVIIVYCGSVMTELLISLSQINKSQSPP